MKLANVNLTFKLLDEKHNFKFMNKDLYDKYKYKYCQTVFKDIICKVYRSFIVKYNKAQSTSTITNNTLSVIFNKITINAETKQLTISLIKEKIKNQIVDPNNPLILELLGVHKYKLDFGYLKYTNCVIQDVIAFIKEIISTDNEYFKLDDNGLLNDIDNLENKNFTININSINNTHIILDYESQFGILQYYIKQDKRALDAIDSCMVKLKSIGEKIEK